MSGGWEGGASTFVTLDIETVPQARYLDPDAWHTGLFDVDDEWARDRENDHGVINLAIEEGKAVLDATGVAAALHATTCHIVQVSFGWRSPMGNHEAELYRRVLQSDAYPTMSPGLKGLERAADAERGIISEALRNLAGACGKRSTIVSFNGKGFDLPVLRARAALLGVIPDGHIPWRRLLYPYADDQHADLRLILGNDNRYAKGTLQWWADAFGIHAEEHGAEVYDWVRNDEWSKLISYGLVEAQTLVELYERVRPIL